MNKSAGAEQQHQTDKGCKAYKSVVDNLFKVKS